MRDKYIKAIRDMLEEMNERDVKFIFAIIQLLYVNRSE